MKITNWERIAFSAILLSVVLGIDAYGHTPTPKLPEANTVESNASGEPQKEPAMEMEISDFPNYHPLVVHFPIVLLLVAGLFQLLAFFVYGKEFSLAALILLVLGTISVWLAMNTFHAQPKDLSERAADVFRLHEQMANYTWWLSLAALVAKFISHFITQRKWWSESVVTLALVAAATTVSITGHYGSRLVYIEGVGPKGRYLEMEGH